MNAGYTRARERGARPAAALLCAALFAGCGNVTAGGYGDAEVYASSDAPDPSPAPGAEGQSFAATEPAGAPSAAPPVIGLLEGDMTVEMDLYVRNADGAEFRLTPETGVDLTLDLDEDEKRAGGARVLAGAYDELRVVVTEASADVLGGIVIDSLPFIGTVSVQIGQAGLDVVLPISFEVPDGGTVGLNLDFNARAWLLTLEIDILNPLTATVTAEAFADALEVSLR